MIDDIINITHKIVQIIHRLTQATLPTQNLVVSLQTTILFEISPGTDRYCFRFRIYSQQIMR